MSLGIKHHILQRDEIAIREQQIEILQCLCHPEALHIIAHHGWVNIGV